jgi:hypothetical protein
MSRRMHLHDADSPMYAGKVPPERNTSIERYRLTATRSLLFDDHRLTRKPTSSSLMSYLFLVDVVRAIHFGATSNFTTRELFIRMPGSPYSFHTVYRCLTSGPGSLPSDLKSHADSILLLSAILSDAIYVYWSLSASTAGMQIGGHFEGYFPGSLAIRPNFNTPLSARSELIRLTFTLNAALDRWESHFGEMTDKSTSAFFYFCKLFLACPEIRILPTLTNYLPTRTKVTESPIVEDDGKIVISEEALNFAWRVLDNINLDSNPSTNNLSIWIPVILFYSALVVWQHLRKPTAPGFQYGTLKALGLFKKELQCLPWQCCEEMVRTLDELMKA